MIGGHCPSDGPRPSVLLADADEQAPFPLPIFPPVARSDPACCDHAHPLPLSLGNVEDERNRPLPQGGAAVAESFRANVRCAFF